MLASSSLLLLLAGIVLAAEQQPLATKYDWDAKDELLKKCV